MTRIKSEGTALDVFSNRAGGANTAVFWVLIKQSPQNIKQMLNQISKYRGLEETYYASLTKRLHRLQETAYLKEEKPAQGVKGQTRCELRIKAYLALFLKENSIQDIIDQATDTQIAFILLALLNVFSPKKDKI